MFLTNLLHENLKEKGIEKFQTLLCAVELYNSNFEGEKISHIFWTIFHKIGNRVVARTQKFVKGS